MVCVANCMVMVAAIVAEDLEGDQSEDNDEADLHLGEDDQRSCLPDREVLQALALSNAIYTPKSLSVGAAFQTSFVT